MDARPYSMEIRGVAAADTRRRILDAARRLLAENAGSGLGLDAIAAATGVSRVTLYNHFGSRAGLLEALYDHLATRGNVHRGMEALRTADPMAALAGFIRVLVQFWASDPVVIRRLHAMAALDAEIATGLAARAARRRRAAREVVRRIVRGRKQRRPWTHRLLADALCAIASFETYDALASAKHGQEEIVTMITHLARSVLAIRQQERRYRKSRR